MLWPDRCSFLHLPDSQSLGTTKIVAVGAGQEKMKKNSTHRFLFRITELPALEADVKQLKGIGSYVSRDRTRG